MIDPAGLVGHWRLARVIRHADGAVARLAGHATWVPEGGAFRCVEEGTLAQGGQTFPARRETLWQMENGRLHVRFADGRPFHMIAPGGHATHDCPPDTYRLRYDISAWPRWSVRWHVTGPRKDYRALTRLSPSSC